MDELTALKVAISPVDKFREFLAIQGKRLTQEREIIVEEVFSDHRHFDADELVDRLAYNDDGRRVSRSTVYRALDSLVQAGLLRKVARTNDRDVYEHDYGYPQHDHLICQKCGSLTEFHNDEISEILDEVSKSRGFRMSGHRLEVHGICEQCAQPKKRKQRLPGTV